MCYLLRAGVPEWVVSILVNWSSNQVQRYANRLALHPGLVSPWGLFNHPRDGLRAGSAGLSPSVGNSRRAGEHSGTLRSYVGLWGSAPPAQSLVAGPVVLPDTFLPDHQCLLMQCLWWGAAEGT